MSAKPLKKDRRAGSEANAWWAIRDRCLNPRSVNWPAYGGRGIGMCERWAQSFDAFVEDMGLRPSPKHSVDRIDNDKGYEPGNCRWATSEQQNRNRRNNVRLTYNGETMTAIEWSERLGVSPQAVRSKMAGWSPKKESWVANHNTMRGERHKLAKLTDAQAAELIRRALAGETRASLAREFGVSGARASALVRTYKIRNAK